MVTSVVTIVSLPIIVRILGPGGYGDYAFLISVFNVMVIFVSSGVAEGLQKYVGEDRNGAWLENVVGFYGRLALGLGTVGTLCVAAFARFGPVESLLGPEFRLYFYLLAALIFAAQMRMVTRRTLVGMGLERFSEPLRILNTVTWIVLGTSLAYVGFGVAGLVVGQIASNGVVALLGGVLVARQVSLPDVLDAVPDSFPRREIFSFNVLNTVLVVLVMSLYHVDIVMLRTLVGDEPTGYYRAALAVAEYLWFVPLSLQTLLLHSTSDLWTDERYERIEALSARSTRYTLLLSVLLALGIGALASQFVPIYYGQDFVAVVTPLQLLLPGAVAFAVARPVYTIAQANGNLKPLVAATGLSALLNLVLNALLIPRYQMVGAAIATGVGYGSMLVFHVASARRLGFDPLVDLRLGRVAATGLVAAVPIFGVARYLSSDLLALAVVPPLGFFVFVGAAVRTRAIDADELAEIEAALPVPIPASVRTIATSVVPSEERSRE